MNKKSKYIATRLSLCGLLTIISLGFVNNALAAITSRDFKQVTFEVALNKSLLVSLDSKVTRITKPNPGIAEVLLFPPNKLILRGISLGTTNVIIWGVGGKLLETINIQVTHDLDSLKFKLYELMPNENIEVRASQKNIVLSGQVTSLGALSAAIDLAQGYLGGSASKSGRSGGNSGEGTNVQVSTGSKNRELSKGDVPQIINLMSVGGGQQVMLEVKVAEIDRRLAKELEVDFQTIDKALLGALPGINNGIKAASFNASSVAMSVLSGQYLYNVTVNGVNDQGLAKILAEPTLTTLSGQEATFLAGGEFPIPVAQGGGGVGNNAISVEFKEFGIGLRFIPVVLDSGRINLNMNVSVSELSDAASIVAGVGSGGGGLFVDDSSRFAIPSLTKREASSTLELGDGQTMSIAGLISDRLRESVSQFPGLGDIPVLGMLFRSTKFLSQKTELVIFVTPRLAKPVLAKDVVLPTDFFIPPDSIDTYILGRLDSRKAKKIIAEKGIGYTGNKGGMEGVYGHQIEEGEYNEAQ